MHKIGDSARLFIFKRIGRCPLFFVLFLLLAAPTLRAEDDLEKKVTELEGRVQGLEKYTEELNTHLNKFSKDLVDQVDTQVKAGSDKVVRLSPVSKKFTKIETNAGMFLIAVNKFQRMETGYRLLLNIGNPNSAKYTGLKLKMHWGKNWDAAAAKITYEEWRASLMSGEYAYAGALPPGQWTEITIELTPPGSNYLEYIECEMEVESVQLQK